MSHAARLPLYLCLDQGGHASRALILDARGEVVARAMRDVTTQQPADDRVEQNPEEVVASLRQAAREVIATLGARAAEVVSAGLATQRSSLVCWDRQTGRALSPVISWQDRRAHAWLALFEPHAADIERRTGLRLSPHYGASKFRWCLENLEAVRTARHAGRLAIGPLASFLTFSLSDTRPFVVDPANAQRTLLWSIETGDWDASLLDLFGVPGDVLPTSTSTTSDLGTLSINAARVPLTTLTGDQAAALFAFGTPADDTAYLNIGTGAFAQRVVRAPRRASGLLTSCVLRENAGAVYAIEGTVNGAGAALAWAKQELNLPDLEAQLTAWLARDTELPIFLNGIGGLGAPYWEANFPTRFLGEGESWQRALAVVESIVFLLGVNVDRLSSVGSLTNLFVTGGLARHDGLCQRLADLTGLPARRPDEPEATARGLAWLLADRPNWPAPASVEFTPRPNAPLRERYRRWRAEMDSACIT